MNTAEKQIKYRKWYNKRQSEVLRNGIKVTLYIEETENGQFSVAREGHEEDLEFVYEDYGYPAQEQISAYVDDVLAEEKKAKRKELFG